MSFMVWILNKIKNCLKSCHHYNSRLQQIRYITHLNVEIIRSSEILPLKAFKANDNEIARDNSGSKTTETIKI